jgi:hypothetical protein
MVAASPLQQNPQQVFELLLDGHQRFLDGHSFHPHSSVERCWAALIHGCRWNCYLMRALVIYLWFAVLEIRFSLKRSALWSMPWRIWVLVQ